MKRKLQVFVSSTFTDLRSERQAAVEAILKAGHIPAGMELFTAGSESQFAVIKRWIEESDVYLLILGGRYGSIEPKSQLSYTEAEFDYARSLGKPFFSVVIDESALASRVEQEGAGIAEQAHPERLKAFRDKVTSQLCGFFESPKDVKLAIFESLPQFEGSVSGGWVSAKDVAPSEDVARQLTALLEENSRLRASLEKSQSDLGKAQAGVAGYEELWTLLRKTEITIPVKLHDPGDGKPAKANLMGIVLAYADDLARGVSNAYGASDTESFLFFNAASALVGFGLADEAKVPARVSWQRLKLSKEGVRFLTWARMKQANMTPASTAAAPTSTAPAPTPRRNNRASKTTGAASRKTG